MVSIVADPLIRSLIQAFEKSAGYAEVRAIETDVAFERLGAQSRLDAIVRLSSSRGSLDIAIEKLATAYPRDVRQAIWTLQEFRRANPHGDGWAIPMVIAQYLSPGGRELLREHDISYFDASGNLYLQYNNSLINIDHGPATPPPRHFNARSLFIGARERVVHALLHLNRLERERWLEGDEIAKDAQTSSYTVSQTMRELELLEFVESEGSGRNLRRRLRQPGALLDAWMDVWRTRRVKRTSWFLYVERPQQLIAKITEKLEESLATDWALTGTAAANVLAPLLTSVQTVELILPKGETLHFADALELRQADTGGNILLTEREGAASMFVERHPEYSTQFASPFVQYLDLQDGRGRNKELAAHLREKILKI